MSVSRSVELGVALPQLVANDFLSKLHYISDGLSGFEFSTPSLDRLNISFRPGREAEAEAIIERIVETARKMTSAFRSFTPKVLVSRMAHPARSTEDPHAALLKEGQLHRAGQGRYGLGPLPLRLMALFENSLLRMADRFDAPRYQFPSLIGADTLERCRYLKSFPHSLCLVSHLREDLPAIQDFARTAHWEDGGLAFDQSDLAKPKCLLAPSVCFHWYAWLADTVLPAPRTITAVGKCFRYESGNLTGLERLWDFSMRELIFTGPKSYVLEQRQLSMDAAVELLDQWGLAYEIQSATDPFFIEEFAMQSNFQRAFDLKFEVRAVLPYKGTSLAIASFNHHQDFFGRSFDIKDGSGVPIETGCIGFGLERLVLAFLAQHGVDARGWPESVRKELGQ